MASAEASTSADGGNEASSSQAEAGTSTAAIAWDPTENPSGIKPTLQNIVATCNLACDLDLKTIAMHARNAEYNPKRFAAVIMRIRDPKTTALIFRSGKMVVTGAKSEADARTAARKYARIIQKLDFPARFADFKIQNMVGSCDVKFPIRLEGLAYKRAARGHRRSGPACGLPGPACLPAACLRPAWALPAAAGPRPPRRPPALAAAMCGCSAPRARCARRRPVIRPLSAARRHSHYSSYEPELFPGLIYRMVRLAPVPAPAPALSPGPGPIPWPYAPPTPLRPRHDALCPRP